MVSDQTRSASVSFRTASDQTRSASAQFRIKVPGLPLRDFSNFEFVGWKRLRIYLQIVITQNGRQNIYLSSPEVMIDTLRRVFRYRGLEIQKIKKFLLYYFLIFENDFAPLAAIMRAFPAIIRRSNLFTEALRCSGRPEMHRSTTKHIQSDIKDA